MWRSKERKVRDERGRKVGRERNKHGCPTEFGPFGILFIWDKFTGGQKIPEEFRRQGVAKNGRGAVPLLHHLPSRFSFSFTLIFVYNF